MTRPPRTAEILLQSLGAQASVCEPLLGDLAEGFAIRVVRDGPDSARRWYYREAIRATPHLLGDWRRSLRPPDIRHFAGVVLTSYVFAVMLILLGVGLAMGAVGALGFSPRPRPGPLSPVQLLALWLPVEITCTVLGGYIAAWLDRRAPLASAIALGLTWSAVSLAVGGITHGHDAPAWYWLVAPVLQVMGPTVGGVLRLRALRAPMIYDHLQT